MGPPGQEAARVTIPRGFTLVADRSDFNPFPDPLDELQISSGRNWVGRISINVPGPNQFNFPRSTVFSEDFTSAGYYWEQETYLFEDAVRWTNTSEETEIIILLGIVREVSNRSGLERSFIDNVRLISEDGAETTSICLEPIELEAGPLPEEMCDGIKLTKLIPGPNGISAPAKGLIQIPDGSRLVGDVVDRKKLLGLDISPLISGSPFGARPPFISRGNWVGRSELHTIDEQGESDVLVDISRWGASGGFYWLRTAYIGPDNINLLNDTGVTQDFILSIDTEIDVDIDDDDLARFETHNLRIVDEEGVATPTCVKCNPAEPSRNCGSYDIPSFSIEDSSWTQLVVPANTATQTIESLFGDDLEIEDYGVTWIIFFYESITKEYVDPGVNGIIPQGLGFWMIQTTGMTIEIDVPTETLQTVLTKSNACFSPSGCAEIPLATRSEETTWSLIGSPFPYSIPPADIRLVTTDQDSDCLLGCTLQNAESIGYVSAGVWQYDSDLGDYIDISQEETKPWLAHWINAYDALDGKGNTVLYPSRVVD